LPIELNVSSQGGQKKERHNLVLDFSAAKFQKVVIRCPSPAIALERDHDRSNQL